MVHNRLRVILMIVMMAVAALAIICMIESDPPTKENRNVSSTTYRLTIENETVVLLENDQTIRVYREIIPEELPTKDRQALAAGISFQTLAEAERAAEDYDG